MANLVELERRDADLVLRGLLRLLTAIVAGRDHLKAQLGSEKGANMVP